VLGGKEPWLLPNTAQGEKAGGKNTRSPEKLRGEKRVKDLYTGFSALL
jgi:hypothetical protein